MGRLGEECSDKKSQLVAEICFISTKYAKCVHRHGFNLNKAHFIDWYHLLRVEEDADIEVIRKQYLKFALQLHPDKNRHPKAEIAFKLVSEAYTCLSDIAKRKAFNLERWKNFCLECQRIPYTNCNPSSNSMATKSRGLNVTDRSRSRKILRGLKEIRERFKEEARVIENCLRTITSSGKESPVFNPSSYLSKSYDHHKSRKESPIFNPSDFQGYPHLRTRVYTKSENLWYLQTGHPLNSEQGRMKYESPIFELKPRRATPMSITTCL